MRNKYTNKALKKGNDHFNNYNGATGYTKLAKPLSFFTMLKWLIIIIIAIVLSFHLLTIIF